MNQIFRVMCLWLLTVFIGCSGTDRDTIQQEIFRHYPMSECSETGCTQLQTEIGQTEQSITAHGFFGWRGSTDGLGRGSSCTQPSTATLFCFIPQSKDVRWYVDTSGFSAADADQLTTGLSVQELLWVDFMGLQALGWTFAPGTSSSNNVLIKAGAASTLYPQGDSRHWIQIGCESGRTLTEPTALDGQWRRCGRVVVTIDVSKIVDDGNTAARNARLRQSAGQAVGFGSGKGLGNINKGQVFQIKAAGSSFLGYGLKDRDLCAMDLYDLSNDTQITLLPSTACDGWTF